MAKTIQPNQVADAFVSVPGIAFNILRKIPAASIYVDSTSFVDVGSGADKMEATFLAPVAGRYLFFVNIHAGQTGGSSSLGQTTYWQLVFDAAGTPQTFTGDEYCCVFRNQYDRKSPTFTFGPVELTAASHTVLVQAKNQYASRAIQIASLADEHVIIDALMVSGSGAGGVLTEQVTLNQDWQTTSAVWVPIKQDGGTGDDVSVTVTTANECVQFGGTLKVALSTTSGSGQVGISIDGADPTKELTFPWGRDGSYRVGNIPLSGFSPQLPAGSHVFTLKALRSSGSGSLYLYGSTDANKESYFQVVLHRGGQVPVQQAGTSVIDTPRAYNFLGAAVENNNGVADIHLGATAPGVFLDMMNKTVASTVETSSSTFVDITGISDTFTVDYAGTYYIGFTASVSAGTGKDTYVGRFRLVFDVGETNEQTIGDDTTKWDVSVVKAESTSEPETDHVTFFTAVTFDTTGTHTVKAQWKRIEGVNTIRLWPDISLFKISGVRLSGSSAGGVLIEKQSLATTFLITNTTTDPTGSPNWQYISPLTINFDTSNEEVEICLSGVTLSAGTGWCTHWLALEIDGSIEKIWGRSDNAEAMKSWGASWPKTFTAGNHTVRLMGSRHTSDDNINVLGADSIYEVAGTGFTLYAKRYRGGLVPIRDNSITVIDTPAAIDFVGDNVTVSNVGGVAQIEFNGISAGIEELGNATLSANYTLGTSFADIDNGGGDALSVTFDAFQGERVFLVAAGNAVQSSQGNSYLQWAVNGTGYDELVTESNSSGFTWGINYSRMSPALNAGSTTITLQGKRNNAAYIASGASIRVFRFLCGYVQPDNVPVFERDASDTSVINAIPAIGASSEMRLLLNDGVRRTATLPLTCDIDVDGIGGRDTGDATGEAAGDLYHLYGVESDADSAKIKLVLSKDAVPGTSGPPSFAVSCYLFTVRVASIGPTVLEKFHMTENGDYYPVVKNDTDYSIDSLSNAVPGTVGSWVNKSSALQALVPESADAVHLAGLALSTSSSQMVYIAAEASPSWTPDAGLPFSQRYLYTGGTVGTSINHKTIAVPGRLLSIWYSTSVATYSTIAVAGYHNALYPGARGGVQAQAKNTLLVETRTTGPVTLNASDDGKLWDNEGAAGLLAFNLHNASIGFVARFAVSTAQTVQVVTHDPSVDIRIAGTITAGASKYISAATVGNTLEIVRKSATLWLATAVNGTWTVST